MKTLIKIVAFAGAGMMALGAAAFAGDDAKAKEKLSAWYGEAIGKFNACDVSAIGQYSAEGHRGYYPDSADLHAETNEESLQKAKEFCDNGGKNDITYEIADIVMLKDAALILGDGHYTRTEPDGTVSVDSDYTFTEVLVKTRDGWKFKHSHIGAVMPEMAAETETASAGE